MKTLVKKHYWILLIALGSILSLLFEENMDPYFYTVLLYAGINVILASSLNLVTGITGQFSMGHAGFMSIGAYTSALVSIHVGTLTVVPQGLLFLGALLSGGIVAGLFGVIVGLPSLRLKGDYLAIVTLGFGEIIRVVLLNLDFAGGARGLPGIPKSSTFSWIFSAALLCVLCIHRWVYSPLGRSFIAVREDEIAASSTGVDTTKTKVIAFVLSSFFAGIAGGLFAHVLTYINPAIFDFNRSFEILIMVVLGGLGSLTGSVVSAVFLTFLREALRPLQEITKVDLRMVLYAILLIVLMLTRPEGVFGGLERFFKKKFMKKENT